MASIAGSRPGSFRDRILSIGSLALYAIPGFWLGLVLTVIFAVQLRWLPASGIETIASGKTGLSRMRSTSPRISRCRSPVSASSIWRYIFASCAPEWPKPGAWITCSPRARVACRAASSSRHVARNALLPLVTMLGLQSAAMLGGSVVIETLFSIPGLGRLAQEAVSSRDTPLLLGIILVSAVLVILINLIVDILYAVLDPRVGASEASA